MINHFLEGPALIHCMKISGARLAFIDSDAACTQKVETSRSEIEKDLGIQIIIHDQITRAEIEHLASVVPDDSYRKGIQPSFPIALFYTRSVL